MGKRGPKPKPTALLEESDSTRLKQREREPIPPDGKPEPPRRLLKPVREQWDRLAPILEEMGLLTVADVDALLELCELNVSIEKLMKQIRKEGRTVEGSQGGVKTNPIVNDLRDERAQRLRLLKEFGLTPSSRTGQHVSEARLEQISGKKKDIQSLIRGSIN